ncbi:MAG: hypothetical protein ABIR94_21760 [Rubrivivax sp.]
MSNKNLSTVANEVIQSYGITAINVINTYRFGGERVIGFMDDRFASAVNRGAALLRQDLRSNLIDSQQRVSGYYVKGLQFGAERAETVVGVAVDLAGKGVSLVSANAERFEGSSNTIDMINRVAMPAANVVNTVVGRIEKGSSALVKRVSGNDVPAKAIATRKLKTVKSEAATTRKRVVKTATKRVSKAVAKTATQTSNAARRVGRQANAAATQTSNAARRVARKASATAKAA